jgi:hypothetical protein
MVHHGRRVVLGNGKTFTGASLYTGRPLGEAKIPLVYGGDVGSGFCEAGKLNTSLVTGKIVVCDPGVNGRTAKGEAVKLAGGAGAILVSTEKFGEQAMANAHILAATAVKFADAEKIKQYIRTNASPVATIVFQSTVVGRKPSSPRMASFSSRGPNLRALEILKPDITAPGVDILAAWTGESSPSALDSDTRQRHEAGEVQHHLRHVHVVPARERHRRAAPAGAPGLEPRRDQVRPDDHRVQRGQRRRHHQGHVDRPGVHAVRARGRPRGPQPRRRPWPRVRRRRRRLLLLPLRARLHRRADRQVHDDGRPAGQLLGEKDDFRRRPQLPGLLGGAQLHQERGHTAPHGAQRREQREGQVQGHPHQPGRRSCHGEATDPEVQPIAADAGVRGDFHAVEGGERDREVHVRVDRVEGQQAHGDEPHRHHLACKPGGGHVMHACVLVFYFCKLQFMNKKLISSQHSSIR